MKKIVYLLFTCVFIFMFWINSVYGVTDVQLNLSSDKNNANLENLAVDNILLYPPFDNNVRSYNLEVPNDVTDLNILAVPENENAKVVIQGETDLKEGDNLIKVIVTAEDGKTQKAFNLNAYRRNQEEEDAYLEEQEKNEKKLEEIYNAQKVSAEIKNTGESNNVTLEENNLVFFILISIIIVSVILTIVILILKYRK